jgi:hypothetical protein
MQPDNQWVAIVALVIQRQVKRLRALQSSP